jgi:photosystem II stability/assembly factor-like uncharacterized protein
MTKQTRPGRAVKGALTLLAVVASAYLSPAVAFAEETSTTAAAGPHGAQPRVLAVTALPAVTHASSAVTTTFSGVSAVSPGVAWVCGLDASIYRTTDGGATWTRLETPLPADEEVTDIEFVSARHGWAIGANNAILRSTDGGDTWSSSTYNGLVYPPYLLALSAVDATHAWIGGYSTSNYRYYHNVVLRTTDGTTWNAAPGLFVDAATGWGVMGIDFPDRQHGWGAILGGALILSNDGGAVWTPPIDVAVAASLVDVSFADTSNGWAVGEDSSYDGFIMHTSDGESWQRQALGLAGLDPLPDVRAVCAVSPSVAWAACADGYVLRTTDGGRTWTFTRPVQVDLNAIAFTSSDDGWVVGDGGTVVKYGDEMPAKPVLTKLVPASGYPRSTVTLVGRAFGAQRGTSRVTFGTWKVSRYTLWSDTRIKVTVPTRVPKGYVKVQVTTSAGASNIKRFLRK